MTQRRSFAIVAASFLLSTSSSLAQAPAETHDLADLATGAVVLAHSSEYSEDYAALLMIDGTPTHGWCSAIGVPFPHEMILELAQRSELDTVVFDNTQAEEASNAGISARRVEVWASTTSHTAGFEKVLAVELPQGERSEHALPKSTEARWLKLVVLSNWGNGQYTELMEIDVIGRPLPGGEPQPPVAGVYATNYELMLFEQDGQQVRGCYDWDGGVLTGTTDGRVIQFEWREDEGTQIGTAIMVLSSDGGALNGLWYEDGELKGLWQGPRAEAGQRPKCTIEGGNAVRQALAESGHAILYGIRFDLDSDRLRADSEPVLRDVLGALQATEDLALVIEGHTDSTGATAHNQDLSERRAASVVRWLVDQGIAAERLESRGFGDSRPVADNASAQGRALNRRVELKRQ